MSEARHFTARCFGGPRDGEMITVPKGRHEWLAPLPEEQPWRLGGGDRSPSFRTVLYRLTPILLPWPGADAVAESFVPAGQVVGCWITDDYPPVRVVEQLRAVAGITQALARATWGAPAPVTCDAELNANLGLSGLYCLLPAGHPGHHRWMDVEWRRVRD